MMNRIALIISLQLILSSSGKDKYDVARYYGVMEQDSVLTSIIGYIYTAPVYTSMQDRFKPEHRDFYSSLTPKFSIYKYFVAEDGAHYFYVIRSAARIGDKRGVGGHFRMESHFQLSGFREVFVTPILPEEELKIRGTFLFDEMVKRNLDNYLKMPTYVQWPNEITVYDTISYEWKLKAEK